MARKANGDAPHTGTAADFLPKRRTLATLKAAVQGCRGCPLYARATQGVIGEGSTHAKMILVGEKPGDREDIEGHPFVGPAGGLLDKALAEAGIDRDEVFVTNVVKHFKWEPRGKRRIHQRPTANEIEACIPWLEAELDLVHPEVLVCLGATAAQALLGKTFRITKDRGRILQAKWAPIAMATWHPSAILRAPDSETRHQLYDELVADLRRAGERAAEIRASA